MKAFKVKVDAGALTVCVPAGASAPSEGATTRYAGSQPIELAALMQASGIWRKGRTDACVPRSFRRFHPVPVGLVRSRSTSGSRCSTSPTSTTSRRSSSSTSLRARSGPEISQTVSQGARGDYIRAARALGRTDVDVVLLQHEYGIFGGRDGDYVLSFARELAQPLVVTLHTVLSEPTPHQLEVLTALCDEAERVIVMTETARRLLVEVGACADDKIDVMPHGAPTELAVARAELDAGRRPRYRTSAAGGYARMESRFLISTFGLLSPGKGIEVMLDALPAVVARHPEVLYVIAGRTHPQIARRKGEEYRLMLERRIVDLGLTEHVQLDDRFLAVDELADLLAATDVFVTPYIESRAELVGRAHLRARGRLRRRLDPVLVRERPALDRGGPTRRLRRLRGARRRALQPDREPGRARRGSRRSRAHRSDVRLAVDR